MKVAIINTPAKGTEVHGAGCADVKKSEKRNKDEAWVIDVDSKLELSHTYWNDQIGDQVSPDSAEGWATAEAWLGEFNFLPCCGDLADGVSPFGTTEVPDLPVADDKVISVWVGWRVADAAIAQGGTLGAKLEARKPNAVLDRTVKLTKAESEALAAVATQLENEVLGSKGAGPVAYSCRTLRDRLAAAWA